MPQDLITLISPALTGAFTLLGTIVGYAGQAAIAHRTQRGQLALEIEKLEAAERATRRTEVMRAMREAHRLLGKLKVEFDLITLHSLWDLNIRGADYDQRFAAIRETANELQMVSNLELPSISKDVEALCGQLGTYWFYFRNLLEIDQRGATDAEKQVPLRSLHDAARVVGERAIGAEAKLQGLARDFGFHATPP